MRKTVAAAAVAASLTVGGAAGVTLFTPTLSGAQTDEKPADDTGAEDPVPDAERAGGIVELLAPLVEDGTITQAQADAVAARLAEVLPDRHGRRPGLGFDVIEAAREALGLEVGELRERLASGESIADIAEAEGVDLTTVTDALVAAHRARLHEAVSGDRLTQEQADELADRFAERIDELVQRSFEPGIGRGPGHHRHGVDDLDDGSADDTTDS